MIDQHSLEPMFVKNLKMMEKYAESMKQLYTGYCNLLQTNPELYNKYQVHEPDPENNAHLQLAKNLSRMRDIDGVDPRITDNRHHLAFFNKNEKETLDSCIGLLRQLSKLERKYRDVALQYTKDTMEFLVAFGEEFFVEKGKLDQTLLIITNLLPKIKKAKTNEELQEYGPRYEEAVNSFNRSSIDLTDFFIYNYPKINYVHQRDIVKFHMARTRYHHEAAELIHAWLDREAVKKAKEPEKPNEKPGISSPHLKKSDTTSAMKKPASSLMKKADSSIMKKPDSTEMKKPTEATLAQEGGKKKDGSKRMSVILGLGLQSGRKKHNSKTTADTQ